MESPSAPSCPLMMRCLSFPATCLRLAPLVLSVACGATPVAAEPADAPTPPEAATPADAPTQAAAAGAPASTPDASGDALQTLDGTWTYAADPRGGDAAQTQAIYKGSTLTFGSDGSYAFKLGATPKPLAGTYTVASWGEEGGVVHTDYGQGRTNQLHLSLHRDGDQVIGFVVRETEQKINPRYYAR